MKNFFLVLTASRKQKLQSAQIAFCDLTVGDDRGVVVEEQDLPRVLEALNATTDGESASGLDGIFRLELRRSRNAPAEKPKITVPKWNREEYRNSYVEAAKRELDCFDEVFLYSVGYADESQRISRGETFDKPNGLRVIVWGSPSGEYRDGNGTVSCRTAWGISLGPDWNWWGPSGQGIPIINPDNNKAIGEVVGQTLFIFAPLTSTSEGVHIFAKILQECRVALGPPEERAKREQERALREQQRIIEVRKQARENYINECGKRFSSALENTRKKITDGRAVVEKLQQDLVLKIRETIGAERKLEQMESCKGGDTEKFGREYDKLLTVPKVQYVTVGNGLVSVFTDILDCVDPRSGKRHEIGKFRIEISTEGKAGGVHWFNLTRQVDGYERGMHAPHVFSDGHACMGNTQETFPQLIGDYEFAAVAMLAIQFIESVNTDDRAGNYVTKWPEAPAVAA